MAVQNHDLLDQHIDCLYRSREKTQLFVSGTCTAPPMNQPPGEPGSPDVTASRCAAAGSVLVLMPTSRQNRLAVVMDQMERKGIGKILCRNTF